MRALTGTTPPEFVMLSFIKEGPNHSAKLAIQRLNTEGSDFTMEDDPMVGIYEICPNQVEILDQRALLLNQPGQFPI